MISLPELLTRAVVDLEDSGVQFAVVGGLAVGVYAEPRFTKDIDFAISSMSDADAEQLTASMFRRGYQLVSQLENKPDRRLRAVRLKLRSDDNCPLVDLLFDASGIESEAVEYAEVTEVFPGVAAPVARPAELIAMKMLASDNKRRHFDHRDMAVLLDLANAETANIVRQRLELITDRGLNRGRDLVAEFDELLTRLDWSG